MFNARIKGIDQWLEQQARRDERALRLQTHPGIGLLTSLALVHSLEPVARFDGGREVAAYVGLEPMEYSSGDKQRFGSISKSGSPAVTLPIGGSGTGYGQKGRGVEEVLSVALAQAGRTEGQSSSGEKVIDPRLHPSA